MEPMTVGEATAKFNEVGMTDLLATLLAQFVVSDGAPEESSELLEYCTEYVGIPTIGPMTNVHGSIAYPKKNRS